MEKSYIEKITAFISNMRDSNEGGDTPSYPEGTEFDIGQSYQYCYYNKDLPLDYINGILEGLEYTPVDGFDGGFAHILNCTGDLGDDAYQVAAMKYPKSILKPGATGHFYMIANDYDNGSVIDNVVYLSEDGNFGESVAKAGWHTEIPGQIYIYDEDHPTILAVNQWDKVKTIFSSTPFEE